MDIDREGRCVFKTVFDRTKYVIFFLLVHQWAEFQAFVFFWWKARVGSTKCRNESCIGQGQSWKMSNFWQGTNCEAIFNIGNGSILKKNHGCVCKIWDILHLWAAGWDAYIRQKVDPLTFIMQGLAKVTPVMMMIMWLWKKW